MLGPSFLRVILLALSVLLASNLWGQAQTKGAFSYRDVPNVQLLDSTRFVSDPSDYIAEDHERAINLKLQAIRSTYAIDFAVVVLPAIDRDIESFANELFRFWGLGDKQHNSGLLFLLVVEERKSRFEVGYGLEGYLTDSRTSSIWRNDMRQYVAAGDLARGLSEGVDAVQRTLEAEGYSLGAPRPKRSEGIKFDSNVLIILYLGFALFVFLFMYIDLRTATRVVPKKDLEARLRLRALSQGQDRSQTILLILCLPLGLLYMALRRRAMAPLRARAELCSQCGTKFSLQTISPTLSPLQELERKIGIAQIHACRCTHCAHQESLRVLNPAVARRYTTCPQCTGHTMELIKALQYRRQKDGKIYLHKTYQCLYCKHQHSEDEYDQDANDEERMMSAGAGLLLGSMLSGRRGYSGNSWGGGGFSGGGWGGGSSGGGGSTGSW